MVGVLRILSVIYLVIYLVELGEERLNILQQFTVYSILFGYYICLEIEVVYVVVVYYVCYILSAMTTTGRHVQLARHLRILYYIAWHGLWS